MNVIQMPLSRETQEKRIRKALEAGDAITPMDALNRFGCFRLGARIYDLRQQGLPIETTRHKDGYAIYRMVRP